MIFGDLDDMRIDKAKVQEPPKILLPSLPFLRQTPPSSNNDTTEICATTVLFLATAKRKCYIPEQLGFALHASIATAHASLPFHPCHHRHR